VTAPKVGWVRSSGTIRRVNVRAPGRWLDRHPYLTPWPMAAVDPPSRGSPIPRDGACPSPESRTVDHPSVRNLPPRAVLLGRRTLHTGHRFARTAAVWTGLLVLALLGLLGALVVVLSLLAILGRTFGWDTVAATGAGAALTLIIQETVSWNRHRHLRELLDWLGEDLDARKIADLRHDQRIKHLRGELP
jgi:hypothetical protein